MHLTLTQTTINQQTYWLGTTPAGLAFVDRANGPRDEWQAFFKSANIHYDQQANQQACQELHDYLTGQRQHFDIPLDQTTGTPLQHQVWQALTRIPYGQAATYSQLATMINHPTAVRAVASAVGQNPLLIVIPCHRIRRKDGQLGGYRGGLPMKRALLALENARLPK